MVHYWQGPALRESAFPEFDSDQPEHHHSPTISNWR